MIPVADLRVEAQMVSPPVPTGFAVMDGDRTLAVLTYDTVKRALAQYEEMAAMRKGG